MALTALSIENAGTYSEEIFIEKFNLTDENGQEQLNALPVFQEEILEGTFKVKTF